MSTSSLDELIKALQQLQPTVEEPLEYRLHYDESGNITQCSMQNHPHGTTYLVVDKETYNDYSKYYVKDGKLTRIVIANGINVQLKRSNAGYPVVKNHASILLEIGERAFEIEYYDQTDR